ncbi:hypothetical protein [Pseudomonas sp. S32]|uniref:hypothetical protein n=1 Tax=Pseudomonas sp. S32 TaxID=2767448 RepID=UPI00191276C2|nr:hypothetical protein [Pseudomonas sp. S32]MBK5003849.1 hypothetical protein [Pseudomonas sp. S32]
MASKLAAAKQAKRYNQEERKKFIDEYINSGVPLGNFCKAKGRPSYQAMKLWLNTPSTTKKTNSHALFTSSTPASDVRNDIELELIQSIANSVAHLEIRLAAVKRELEKIIRSASSNTPDYHRLH